MKQVNTTGDTHKPQVTFGSLQQTYPQNVFTKFIHSFQDVVKVQGSQASEVKHVDLLKQKGGPRSEVPKDAKAVKGAKQKKKASSQNGDSRKHSMKMKVQFMTWQNVYKLYLWTYVLLYYFCYFCFLPEDENPYDPFNKVCGTHSRKFGHAKDEKREWWEDD